MARPLRINFEDAVYHIIARGNRKEKIIVTKLPGKEKTTDREFGHQFYSQTISFSINSFPEIISSILAGES